MSITLSEARTLLSRYAGAGNNFTDRINQVCERLMKAGNYKDTKRVAGFEVFSDIDENPIITLPRGINTILAGDICGSPMRIHNGWFQFSHGGPGLSGICGSCGLDEVPGSFTTFQDWTDSMLLRIRMETNEAAGAMIIKGTLLGEKIYTSQGGTWKEGVKLSWALNDTVATTTNHFDLPPYQIVKPVTNGRIALYVVDSDGNETLVALYEPTETSPSYRRYKLPRTPSLVTADAIIGVGLFYTKEEIDALFGDDAPITVSSDTDDILSPASPFVQWFQKILAQAGTGSYTAKFSLSHATPKKGAIYRIAVDLAQSANPHIQIYDSTSAGTLLVEVDGDSSNAQYWFGEFEYNDASWALIASGFLT